MNAGLKQSKMLQRQSLREFVRWMAAGSPGSQLFEARGLEAAIVPAAPRVSIPNSVVYETIDALDRSLHKLDSAYKQAEVGAWMVWVPEDDKEVIAMLGDAKLAYDGDPAAMEISLDGFEAPDLGDLDWDAACPVKECAEINDDAYGHGPSEGWGPAMSAAPDMPTARFYRARVAGVPACTLGTIDGDGDLGVYYVATRPEHSGQGLMSRLLGQALAEARDRGLETSSLQASAEGEPIYAKLGYETKFRWHLYERRIKPDGSPSAAGPPP